MRENYELFRQEYFSGVKMPSSITLEPTTRMTRAWGKAWWHGVCKRLYAHESGRLNSPDMNFDNDFLERSYIKRNIRKKMLVYPDSATYRIQLDVRDFLPEVVYEGVLVHEMVHICCYCNRLWAGEGHDGWFRKIGDYITKKSGGRYNIQRYISKDEVADRERIKGAVMTEDSNSGWVVKFVLSQDLQSRGTRRWNITDSMFYWIDRQEQVDGFLAKASMDPAFLDTGRKKHLFPFKYDYGTKQCHAKITKAVLYEVNPDNIGEERKKHWAKWVRDKCLVGNPAGGNPPITDVEIAKWEKLAVAARQLVDAGAMRRVSVMEDLFSEERPKQETGVAAVEDKPAVQEAPKAPEQGQDPIETVKAMPPDERKRFFSGFYPWYKGLDMQQKGMLEDNGRVRHPGWTEQQVFVDYYLRKFHVSEIPTVESIGLDEDDELEMIAESLLGRMYDKAKDWLRSLVDRVFASLYGKQEIIDCGDGTYMVGIS